MGVLGIITLILITVGVTYAVFNYTKLGTTENTITSGTLKFLYTENTGVGNGISITNALPVNDEVGKNYSTDGYVFDFKIEAANSGAEAINYEVTLRKKNTSTLVGTAVKVYLTDMTSNTDISIIEPTLYNKLTDTTIDVGDNIEKTLYQGNVPGGDLTYLKNFRLRMWVDDKADFSSGDLNDKSFIATVNVYANANVVSEPSIYTEALLNGTDPVLKDNLVPINIANDGTVTKADITSEWYNYENKIWANAVILKDKTINYNNGGIIPEENIESYFVWIPKYSYQLWDLGNYTSLTTIQKKEHTIPISFGTTDTSDSNSGECTTPGTSGESGNCKIGDYMTHPAFQAFDSTGFWVGKFETGYDGASTKKEAQINSNDANKIIVKPNVYSWRTVTIGNAFKASYDYQRDLDSHMMKNTEWGAVAYLQHSKNGSSSSVRINNNISYLTGYSATVEPTCLITSNIDACNRYGNTSDLTNLYNTETGFFASTTGNISGIYDMSGGAAEYVMGYNVASLQIGGGSGITTLYSDFFTNNNWNKYYDKYTSSVVTNYNKRILGDATGEMGSFFNERIDLSNYHMSSWYSDGSFFLSTNYSWFDRGGNMKYGSESGIFYFSSFPGAAGDYHSFRLVLTPNNS